MPDEVFSYHGYDIPIDLMNLTGGGPDTFEAISGHHIAHIQKHLGIKPGQRVVEIGCGIGRDAIPLAEIIGPQGHYIGFDITKPSIDWCQANISARHPNFRFFHLDIFDPIYNNTGKLNTCGSRFPVESNTADLIIAQSVFTHMIEDGVRYYLHECRRVLKPEGSAYLTCFIVNDEIRDAIQRRPATTFNLSFRYLHSADCFINLEECPTAAVAYTLQKIEDLAKSAGLKFRKRLVYGNWSGLYPESDCGQDTLLLCHT